MINPFSEIDSRLSNIEKLLLDLKHQPSQSIPEVETPIQLDEVVMITALSKPTLYGYCQRNEIPYHKKGNRLFFFKSEIIDWIKKGKNKTVKELEAETDEYLSTHKKGFRNEK